MPPTLHFAFEDDTTPHQVRVRMEAGGRRIGTIFFRSDTTPMTPAGDSLLCLGLTPALELRAPLRIESPVSPELLGNSDAVQSMLRSWYPYYREISVAAEPAARSFPSDRGTALFYSSGIDSSYSLAVEHGRLDALITIVDADAAGRGDTSSRRLVESLDRVSDVFGLEPVVIESNVRAVMQPFLAWTEFHGSAMAAIRHLLGQRFHTVLIASSGDETTWSTPWGSHPALDPLLGTRDARIEHHGLVKRLDKIRAILKQPVLMERMHICNSDPVMNCGRCPKCHFAMAALRVLDADMDAPTFAHAVGVEPDQFEISDDALCSEFVYLRDAAALSGRNPRIAADIGKAIAAYDAAKGRRTVVEAMNLGGRLKRLKHRARYWRASR